MTKNTLEEAAPAMQAISTARWSDHEKRTLQNILGMSGEEIEEVLRWVVSIRTISSSSATADTQPATNSVLWSR